MILLLFIPLIAGLLAWLFPSRYAAGISVVSNALVAILVSSVISDLYELGAHSISLPWMTEIHSRFALGIHSLNATFLALSAIVYLLVSLWTLNKNYKDSSAFYALLSFSQVGVMGVFLSMDALLFYLFWELALIPMYFLVARWGSGDATKISFRFFIYTFVGSVLMLVALFYLYYQHGQTFEWVYWMEHASDLSASSQRWMLVLMLLGLGVKIPIFPLHSWQASTYKSAPRPVTVVLSALMSKMGVFGLIHWMMYILPSGFEWATPFMVGLAIVGILYASLVAMDSGSMVRVLAFSSIAHLGLMVLGLFATPERALSAVAFQILSHGLVVMALWMLVEKIEDAYGSDEFGKISGGLASTSSSLALFMVFFAFANVGLPLTMNFVGEYMLLFAAYLYKPMAMVLAGLSVIFGAVYMLRFLRKILYGNKTAPTIALSSLEMAIMSVLVIAVLLYGVYPYPVLQLTEQIPDFINTIKK